MASHTTTAVSCVECQRRKQKCNREFPCNHCLKRGVSHLCRVASKPTAPKTANREPTYEAQLGTFRKRSRDGESSAEEDPDLDDDPDTADVTRALKNMGYLSHHYHLVLCQDPDSTVSRALAAQSESEQSEELKAALPLVPEKRYTDCLVDNWLNGGNYQSYALYPPQFRTQYDGWWATPRDKVTPELTSLILRVCACSLQFIVDSNVKARLETELGVDVQTLAKRMHALAEKISASIRPGNGGLVHVQQLFHAAFWLRTVDKWTEAWHALSDTIRAANEIGLHQDSSSEGMSAFDREMRRRTWAILYVWDFVLGALLCRPHLINQADSTVVVPTLTLENDPERPDLPAPFRHVALHCQLCLDIAAQFQGPIRSRADNAEAAWRMQKAVDRWFAQLPTEYALDDPNTDWNAEYGWVKLQRRYLHLAGYLSTFSKLRPFITQNSAKSMTTLESNLRLAGVQARLGVVDVSWNIFEEMSLVGTRCHYANFCIFDSAVVLCSALLHDEACSLPQRDVIVDTIRRGLRMLAEAASGNEIAAELYRILKGLHARLPSGAHEQGAAGRPKRLKNGTVTPRSNDSLTQPVSDIFPDTESAQNSMHPTTSTVSSGGDIPSLASSVSSAATHPPGPSVAEVFAPVNPVITTGGFPALDTFENVPGFAQAVGLQDSCLPPVPALVTSQTEWQPSHVPLSDWGNVPQIYPDDGSQAVFDNTAPPFLHHWDWQELGLGHPSSWDPSSYAQLNGQGSLPGGMGDT